MLIGVQVDIIDIRVIWKFLRVCRDASESEVYGASALPI